MKLQFGKMIKVLEMDGGDGCTTTLMWLMLLNCTFRNCEDSKFSSRAGGPI